MNARMIMGDIPTFSLRIADRSALMGLDLGEKTIGMAISDDGQKIASGSTRYDGRDSTDAKPAEHRSRISVGGFILGLPLNMNGTGDLAVNPFGSSRPICRKRPIFPWRSGTNASRHKRQNAT